MSQYSQPRDVDARQKESSEPTLAATLSQIATDSQKLARQEIALAKAEVREWAQQSARALIKVVAGGWLLLLGSVIACVAAVHGLEDAGLSTAISGAIVALLLIGVGVLLVMRVPRGKAKLGDTARTAVPFPMSKPAIRSV